MVGVAQDDHGLDLNDLQRTVAAERAQGRRVKLLYVIPNFQNPTGRLVTRARRAALLEWALRERVLVLEDDPYCELYFDDTKAEETRPMAADTRRWCLGTFSKTLAPGFRVGWMSASPVLAAKLEIAKQAVDLHTGALDQMIVYEACRRGVLGEQGPRLRRLYQDKRDVMMAALDRHAAGRLRWAPPRGGFFLWATLVPPFTSEGLLPHASKQGVLFVPGTAFHVDDGGHDTLRLSFAEPTHERIEVGISRLCAAVTAAGAATA
jgi:2-aminoadipate transaminase